MVLCNGLTYVVFFSQKSYLKIYKYFRINSGQFDKA